MRPSILPLLLFPLVSLAAALPASSNAAPVSARGDSPFKICGHPKSCELNNCAGEYYKQYDQAACTVAFLNCICIRSDATPYHATGAKPNNGWLILPDPPQDDEEEKKKKKKKGAKGHGGGGGPAKDPGCPPKVAECREDP